MSTRETSGRPRGVSAGSCTAARSTGDRNPPAEPPGCCFGPTRRGRRLLSLLVPGLLSALLVSASAADAPHWWIACSVLDTNAVPNDYAPVNQGQAKWMAVQAAAELDRLLPGGAGPAISNLTAGFGSGGNELPLNLGQLKFLAAPFYDRIRAEGFTNALPEEMPGFYPWTEASSDDNDFAPANIGQLKRVFSFDLEMCFDTDGDGISDGMEGRLGLDKNNPADAALPSAHPWAHGLTNLQVSQNRSVLRADNFSTLGDGIPDWWKVKYGYALNDGFLASSDDDGDMWSGLEEYQRGSDPRRYDRLTLRFERRELTAAKGGFSEFQASQPPKRYLRQVDQWGDWIVVPFQGCAPVGAGATTSLYDVATEIYTAEPSGVGAPVGTPPATSPTSRVGIVTGTETCGGCQWVDGSEWWSTNEETQEVTWESSEGYSFCPGHDGTQQVQMDLFDEFTTPMLVGHLAETMPLFSDEFDQVWVDQGVFGFETDPLQGTPAAWFDISSDELTAGAGKIQYKFWLDSAPLNRFVSWMEVFTPEDDPATPQDESATPEYTFRHWPDDTHPDTGQDETPVFTIDLLAAAELRQGTNRIVVLPRAHLVADWNHDRVIADDDDQALPRNPFRFWVNDDTDMGDEATAPRCNEPGCRIPVGIGEGQSINLPLNNEDSSATGRADLADFFPVWLGLTNLLAHMPSESVISCRLRQADSAVRVVFTDLTRTNAGAYLATDGTAYGPDLNHHSYEAPSILITADGVEVPLGFLARLISDPERGVFLVEGVAKTTQPLVLEVRRDGTPVGVAMLPLSIDTISKMYGWINLRAVAGGRVKDKTNASEPPANYPKELCNGKHVVFVHGYNVDEDSARASASEVFKRLYQSGSRARFTAVTWYGDEVGGALPAPLYPHLDVANAFRTAPSLASCVCQLPGEIHLLTHSMGGLVAASAIHDHGLAPAQLYMLDAAVAMEAFDPQAQSIDEMRPPDWAGYADTLLASRWYDLFPTNDGRHALSWRNLIGDIPQAINYFSSGEEVLKNNTTPGRVYPPSASDVIEGFFEGVWVYQERMKGCWEPALLWGTASQGGWGFNDGMSGYGHWVRVGGSASWGRNNAWERLSVQEANQIAPEQLRRKSFFKPFERGDLYDPDAGSKTAAEPMVRAKVLAEAIPALSWATGANAIPGVFSENNFDMMNLKNGWPEGRINHDVKGNRWLHGDFRDVAYFFVSPLYDDICTRGGLR